MGDAPPEIRSVLPLPELRDDLPAFTVRLGWPPELRAGAPDWLVGLRLVGLRAFAAATREIRCSLPSAAIGEAPPESRSLAEPSPESSDLPASTLRLRGVADASSDFRPVERDWLVPERS
jgi:hypothetical protein